MRTAFDASALVRALLEREPTALAWLGRLEQREISAVVPDLIFPEVAQVLVRHVRAGKLSRVGADLRLGVIRALPVDVRPLARIAAHAMGVALARNLSVYDACYAVVAEAEDAVLVTADRALAEAVPKAELVG